LSTIRQRSITDRCCRGRLDRGIGDALRAVKIVSLEELTMAARQQVSAPRVVIA
jgi:hypothetical protein